MACHGWAVALFLGLASWLVPIGPLPGVMVAFGFCSLSPTATSFLSHVLFLFFTLFFLHSPSGHLVHKMPLQAGKRFTCD